MLRVGAGPCTANRFLIDFCHSTDPALPARREQFSATCSWTPDKCGPQPVPASQRVVQDSALESWSRTSFPVPRAIQNRNPKGPRRRLPLSSPRLRRSRSTKDSRPSQADHASCQSVLAETPRPQPSRRVPCTRRAGRAQERSMAPCSFPRRSLRRAITDAEPFGAESRYEVRLVHCVETDGEAPPQRRMPSSVPPAPQKPLTATGVPPERRRSTHTHCWYHNHDHSRCTRGLRFELVFLRDTMNTL